MSFGKHAADSFITDTPVAPVVRYTVMEQKLEVVLKDIPLIGFMDTYEPEYQWFREYKTGKRTWDQKRVDSHGQITMYALMLYITYKTPPEEMRIHLDWIPTQENGDFTISFAEPRRIVSFETKRTMQDITKFISKIRKTRERMIKYCLSRGAEVIPKELAEPYLH